MLQLVGILPWTRRMQRRPADMLAAMRASVSGSLQARSFFAAAGGPAEQRRSYAKRAPGSKDDGEKPPAAPPADTITETEDAVEAEDEYSFPASLEKALVKATVPDFVPELIGVPIDRRPVFPGFYKTFSVRDERVAAALTRALKKGQPYVGLFLSKDSAGRDSRSTPDGDLLGGPADAIRALEDVFAVGTFAQIVNLIPSKGDGITAIVYPHRRIRATGLLPEKQAGVSRVHVENCPAQPYNRHSQVIQALMQEIFVMLTEVAKLNPFFREHITHHNVPSSIFEEPAKLADFIAVLTSSPAAELQEILETEQVEERLRKALVLLKKELMTAELQSAIRKEVETKLNKKQREYMLHEQLRTIKKELGLETDTKEKLAGTFRERAAALAMPEDVRRVFDEELGKLAVLEPAGSEFSVTRNYLDWLTLLPWGRFSAESFDIGAAARVLDEDHYGLQDVKDRILEFIAVAKLRGSVAGKILCLVGPPGVGKTSIGRSIARALGRQYFRFSVGGLADVAEIKGHRRTYVGAMPGKLIQALKKVQTGNPLVLIDEIDKLGKGQQGDPASALLELLDPEQNAGFLDHYLDVPVDLSKVLFVCTANTTDSIPGPLLDRMEVISLSGYVAQEKMEIARRYLVPAARAGAGLTAAQAPLPDAVLDVLNREYCREAGVRNLKKHIEKLFRKAALRTVQEGASTLAITTDSLKAYVGSPVFASEKLYGAQLPPGVVTGLAWTSMGGSILYMETILERVLRPHEPRPDAPPSPVGAPTPGLIRTGQLGKVMEESSSIAYSYAKAFLAQHHPASPFFQHAAIHLHVPEGATPKDGPSAGATMATALLSLALARPISADLAMTGELSLTGKILKIGGVKEKLIAARRAGITTVVLPRANQADWDDLPDYIREGIAVHFVESFPEIARLVGLLA